MSDIERMIKIVCGLIQDQTGIDVEKAASITDPEIKDEILRRVWDGERIKDVVEDCRVKYGRSVNFSERK